MQIEVGMVLNVKVTGITSFGAFVELPEGKSGLIHISEIASAFVEVLISTRKKVRLFPQRLSVLITAKSACQ